MPQHPGAAHPAMSGLFNGTEVGCPAADAAGEMQRVPEGFPVEDSGGL